MSSIDIGRGARLGKYTAKAINQLSSPEFQTVIKNPSYKKILKQFLKPDFEPRKKGEPKTKAHISELQCIDYAVFNVSNPKHFATLIREYCHVRYSVPSANRIKNSLLENL